MANKNNSFVSGGPVSSSSGDQGGHPKLPDSMSVLPVAEISLYPGLILPLLVAEPSLIEVVQGKMTSDRMLAFFAVKDDSRKKEELTEDDLHEYGASAYVLKMSRTDEGVLQVLLQGLSRIKLKKLTRKNQAYLADVEHLEDLVKENKETEALMSNIRSLFTRLLELSPALPKELGMMNQNIQQPGLLADGIASTLNLKKEEKLELLSLLNVQARLRKVSEFLQRELDVLELGSKIHSQIKGKIDKGQREYYLREQLKAIQAELGETDESSVEIEELEKALSEKGLPEAVAKTVNQELERLKRMNTASAEFTVAHTYLDWFVDLPWSYQTEDILDLELAQKVLDEDHYGLEKVKKRIIEYLAVRRLKPDMAGPILCLVGPPGTGKTSLGQSIARAMGRKFVRISLGGVRDEAEIRGHRRTYVGALPGRIIQGLKKAGSSNPIFMLDEIDKLGSDFRGDPSSALLEVLDPAQNSSFADHYLEVEYDLSKVMFITTANVLDTIPGPLLDRMEVLGLSGYTETEKLAIAKKYLLPRQRDKHGLKPGNMSFRDTGLKKIISSYTREAGVRNLEREIANVCRHVATEVVKGNKKKISITGKAIPDVLGPVRYESEVRARTSPAGVAVGLAVTQVGGDILFIEATSMPGGKGLILTGQLGSVMKESAQAALSYVRAHVDDIGFDKDFFNKNDIHIHIPAGATPKDGPSAGVTLVTALTSLVTGKPVPSDLAMTGEVTLRGLVMPVGGVKEKVLAASRAGIKNVIIPAKNERDLIDVPDSIKSKMNFFPVQWVDEVLDLAFKRH